MKKKIASVISLVVVSLVAWGACATLYDIDKDVNIIDQNWHTTWVDEGLVTIDGHAIRTYTLTIKNHDVITYENVLLLLQWAWVKDYRAGTGTMWYEMPYHAILKRWFSPDYGAFHETVVCQSFDEDGFLLLADVANINLALQIPGTFEGVPFEEASAALTDSVPYWIVGDGTIYPGEEITITVHVEYWGDDPNHPDYPFFLAGDVIGTPIPEPSLAILLVGLVVRLKRK